MLPLLLLLCFNQFTSSFFLSSSSLSLSSSSSFSSLHLHRHQKNQRQRQRLEKNDARKTVVIPLITSSLVAGTFNTDTNHVVINPAAGITTDRYSSLRRLLVTTSIATMTGGILNAATITPARAAAFISVGVPSVSDGMAAFAANHVEQSIEIYDALIRQDRTRTPYLWQRGLALYYAGRYAEGATQFANDVAVNPNDTEEQIWHLLCLSKMDDIASLSNARPQKLTVGTDRRPVMRLVQQLFLTDTTNSNSNSNSNSNNNNNNNNTNTTDNAATTPPPLSDTERTLRQMVTVTDRTTTASLGNPFYAALYLSLYYESCNRDALAQQFMLTALETDYARSVMGRRDPMVDVATVAVQRRGWGVP